MRFPTYTKLVALLLIVASCKEDNSNPGFIDQQLAGEISGSAYTSASGGGQAIDWMFDDSRVDISIGGAIVNDPCNFDYEGPLVTFIVPKVVGSYTLDEDWSADASVGQYLVYLFPNGNSEPDDFIILSDGTIEILTINNESIMGRVNARKNEQNFVNGNFTIPYCEE